MIHSRRKIFLGLSGGLTVCTSTRTEYIDRSDSERCHFNELRPDEHSVLTCQLFAKIDCAEENQAIHFWWGFWIKNAWTNPTFSFKHTNHACLKSDFIKKGTHFSLPLLCKQLLSRYQSLALWALFWKFKGNPFLNTHLYFLNCHYFYWNEIYYGAN